MKPFSRKHMPCAGDIEQTAKRFEELDSQSLYLFLYLIATNTEMSRLVGPVFKKYNLSRGRFLLLKQLLNMETGLTDVCSPAELAEHLNVTRATITGLVDGLLQDGLVERSPDPDDRRRYKICLSQSGMDLLNKMLPEHFVNVRNIFSVLSSDEKEQLLKLLDRVCARIDDLIPDDEVTEGFCPFS